MGRHLENLSIQEMPKVIPKVITKIISIKEYQAIVAELAELFYLHFEASELKGSKSQDSRSVSRKTLAPREDFLKERAIYETAS